MGRALPTWELEFVVRVTVDEVWRSARDPRGVQAVREAARLLRDTRRHLVSCQVRRQRGLVARSNPEVYRRPIETTSSRRSSGNAQAAF